MFEMLNAQQIVFLHMTTQKNVHMLYTTKENQHIPSYMQLKKSSTWPFKVIHSPLLYALLQQVLKIAFPIVEPCITMFN
jgi:hypothetical protein